MNRKSVDTSKNQKAPLEIIRKEKVDSIDEYLPSYTFSYDGVESLEADALIVSLDNFIRANQDLVKGDYQSKSDLARKEGFARAIAIVELFFKSLYIDEQE